MVIYEVNLIINNNILFEYQVWLKNHIREMMTIEGFSGASLCQEVTDKTEMTYLTVRYELTSKQALDNYLTKQAPKIRQDGLDKFGDQFSANRRFFETLDTWSKDSFS